MWAVVLAVVAAVVAAGLVFVFVVQPAMNRPAEALPVRPVVDAYLDAVADGDATGALAMTRVDEGTFDGASTAFLSDEVLRGAQERITDPRVEALEISGYRATTTVAYTLAGDEHVVELRWDYDEDAQEWQVLGGLLATVRVEGLGGDAVPVTVVDVTPDPVADCYGPCAWTPAYALFAGVYPFRADLSGFEVHPENTTPAELLVPVTPGTSESVRYLAVPQGEEWPVVNGNPTDPSSEATEG